MTHARCVWCGGVTCTCFDTDEEYEMPDSVSDGYDPEFGTGENASDVTQAVKSISGYVGSLLGPGLTDIVQVAQGEAGKKFQLTLSERQLRLIRFACNRALESL